MSCGIWKQAQLLSCYGKKQNNCCLRSVQNFIAENFFDLKRGDILVVKTVKNIEAGGELAVTYVSWCIIAVLPPERRAWISGLYLWSDQFCFTLSLVFRFKFLSTMIRCIEVLWEYLELKKVLCKANLPTVFANFKLHAWHMPLEFLFTVCLNVHFIVREMVRSF